MSSVLRFTGRTAVVTGGAEGLGQEVCAAFAVQGAAVTVVDISREAVDVCVASLRPTARRLAAMSSTSVTRPRWQP
jgi:3-oxoacyl-[acyl-carrier protein] reductase